MNRDLTAANRGNREDGKARSKEELKFEIWNFR